MEDDPKGAERRKRLGWVGLGLLVAALVALVVWSLPGSSTAPGGDASAPTGEADDDAAPAPAATHVLARPAEATCELAILTERPEAELGPLASNAEAAKLLGPAHCGSACDAVKKAAEDRGVVEIETQTAADYMLPPDESLDAVGATLTPEERKSVSARPTVVIVRTHAKPSVDQLAARACFALTQALAEKLSGLVYDESVRRIESVARFAAHGIRSRLGEPVFSPQQIVVQLYRQDDGTARLLTLGMQRFGSPDFIVRGASMATGPALANVVTTVAAKAAAMQSDLPFRVDLDDVARALGRKREDLASDASAPAPVTLDATEAERAEGDPDNDIVELVPAGGANGESWDRLVVTLTGRAPQIVPAADDAELRAIAARARQELPRAIARFTHGEGTLFVKGPFPVAGADSGVKEELMWIEVRACDARACTGTLANEPGYATNLAMGKPAEVRRAAAVDWMLKLHDGGTAGGASIDALERRR